MVVAASIDRRQEERLAAAVRQAAQGDSSRTTHCFLDFGFICYFDIIESYLVFSD